MNTQSDTSTRYIGNCQLCESDWKLNDGRCVHHGYKRPGHGSIEGDCPGVGEVPYETSCELIKKYLGYAKSRLVHLKEYLGRLKRNEITHLTVVHSWGRGSSVEYAAGVTDLYKWERALEHERWDIDHRIGQCVSDIERMTKRIAAWKPQPIRTVEELKIVADKLKADRAQAAAERRAARDAKEAAKKARREALIAKRDALAAPFAQAFRELAAEVADGTLTHSEAQSRARAVNEKLAMRKFDWLGQYDYGYDRLQCDEALLALGLAVRVEHPIPKYRIRYKLGRHA